MAKINIKIEGVSYQVEEGLTILEAAKACGYEIPSLCAFNHGECSQGSCRVCLVEVKGARGLVTACVYPVNEGMEIFTNTPKVVKARKMNLELLLSGHERKCLSCIRSTNCELQKLCRDYGVEETTFEGERNHYEVESFGPSIVRDNNKCVLCRRCVAACQNQGVGVIGAKNRGFDTNIGCAFDLPLDETSCINCGQCIVSCPVGALYEEIGRAHV